mgnify:CR=1 FL=1
MARVVGALGTPEAAAVLHSFCLAYAGCVAMLEQLHDEPPLAAGDVSEALLEEALDADV